MESDAYTSVLESMKESVLEEEKKANDINSTSRKILESKYYAPGERDPEDLFLRVAKVCSIPDVLERVYSEDSGVELPVSVFSPHQDVVATALLRRYGKYRINVDCDKDKLEGIWGEEADKYYRAMLSLDFMPASPTLMNAGRNGMLSSCFFLRVQDSIESIFQTAKDLAYIFKLGGGVGLDFSEIRPEGARISTSNGEATGPISYMRIYDAIGDQISQGGVRRAAMMAMLDVTHPDIMKFITCKKQEGILANFNMSVLVPDYFMDAVEEDEMITLRHAKDSRHKDIRARELWDALVDSAHSNGEPGIIFKDTLERGDVFSGRYGKLGVNPCLPGYSPVTTKHGVKRLDTISVGDEIWSKEGWTTVQDMWESGIKEVYMYSTDAGNFCSTEDHRVVVNGEKKKVSDTAVLETLAGVQYKIKGVEALGEEKVYDITVSNDSHTFMCWGFNVSNCAELPLLDGESCQLGAINLKNCYDEKNNTVDYDKLKRLVRLGVRFLDNTIDVNQYPLEKIENISVAGRKIGLGVMGLHDLLLLCGLPYSASDEGTRSLLRNMFANINRWALDMSGELGKSRGVPERLKDINIIRRNAGLLSAQPTGTVSRICNQVSSGIEPVFRWSYNREDSFGVHKTTHFMISENGYAEDSMPKYAKTASEISAEDHVGIQALIQQYIDHSISKTVITPMDSTRDEIAKVIKYAYGSGCNSITAYREGSRKKEVLVSKHREEHKEEEHKPVIRERPRILPGITFRIQTPGGKAYITINEDEEGIRESFIHISKAGSEIGSHVESEGRLISYALKHRLPIDGIISHLAGQKSNPIWEGGRSIKSVPDAVAKCIEEYIKDWEGFSKYLEDTGSIDHKEEKKNKEISGDMCPECGEMLYNEGWCQLCNNCAYSSCS